VKRILRSRLPERLADDIPSWAVEIGVALIITGLMVLLRLAIVPLAGDRAPFAFVFIAAAGATVLAGWRSGLFALVLGQLLVWYFIVYPMWSFRIVDSTRGYALLISTIAELIVVAIIALYQREVDRAWSRREVQVELMQQALAEIDHRTTNNYQTVLALVTAQARHAEEPVKQALLQVADRIEAIAMASKQLALSSDSLEQVRVTQHLSDLCTQIKRGLGRPGVSLECHADELSLDADKAVAVSIIINELVTNALKHAFPDDRHGSISVSLRKASSQLQLEVADDGVGLNSSFRSPSEGLGSRLIEMFVKQLRADYRLSSDGGGTRHLVTIPLQAEAT
jgi:two-component sensor histidine kinase